MDTRDLPTIVLRGLHKVLVTGALSKGWGGPICRAALPLSTHIAESSFWLLVVAIVYKVCNIPQKYKTLVKNVEADLAKTPINSSTRWFDLAVGTLHLIMFAQIIYYKANILSMVNMIQPCHVILLLQGIALCSTGSTGVVITLAVLPALTGTLLAMLFPDTAGLDQPLEMEAYWLQHYLVQAVPLYLLVRRDFLALRHASSFTVLLGIWILLMLHFSLYEVVDLALDVNVEFMLCPTAAMHTLFPLVPSWVLWPSYRSTLSVVVFVVGTVISYLYIGAAALIRSAMKPTAAAGVRVKKQQ